MCYGPRRRFPFTAPSLRGSAFTGRAEDRPRFGQVRHWGLCLRTLVALRHLRRLLAWEPSGPPVWQSWAKLVTLCIWLDSNLMNFLPFNSTH